MREKRACCGGAEPAPKCARIPIHAEIYCITQFNLISPFHSVFVAIFISEMNAYLRALPGAAAVNVSNSICNGKRKLLCFLCAYFYRTRRRMGASTAAAYARFRGQAAAVAAARRDGSSNSSRLIVCGLAARIKTEKMCFPPQNRSSENS